MSHSMGVFEMPKFAEGTFAIAKLLADLTAKGATTIIGGQYEYPPLHRYISVLYHDYS